MILADAIQAFRVAHKGQAPSEVVVTPSAAVIMAAQEVLPPQWDGVSVRLARPNEAVSAVSLGKGTYIWLSVLPDVLDRPSVVAHEAINPF